MSERGTQLFQMADGQLSELIGLLSTCDEAGLILPCPGRQKLADGTVGAVATHTAANYVRIAGLIAADPTAPPSNGTHRSLRSNTSRFGRRGQGEHGPRMHGPGAAGPTDRAGVLDRLSRGREAMRVLAGLTDDSSTPCPRPAI